MGRGWLRRGLRAPLLHFLVLGAALSAFRPAPPPLIVLSGADLERVRGEFHTATGRPPDEAELEALLARAIDEEILLDQARTAGRHGLDGVVATRLARLGRFVGPGDAETAEASIDRARALGLDRSDPVIRRHRIEQARLAIGAEADRTPPDDEALQAHLDRHRERYRLPERIRLRHLYLSARREDPGGRAARLGLRLRSGAEPATPDLGDPFPLGHRLVASRNELERSFGEGFGAGIDFEDLGRWQGPIPSIHGLHWVWLDAPIPARLPGLDEVRSQVLQDLVHERREAHLRTRLARLREGYGVRIEGERAAP